MRNADMPMVPTPPIWIDRSDDGEIGESIDSRGLTKREYFAGLAMQGILANETYDAPRRKRLGGMATDAVAAADALLAELDKEQQS